MLGFGRPAQSERFKTSAPIVSDTNTPRDRIDVDRVQFHQGGNAPADWGRSIYCSRMRRKNKLRGLGLAGSKI